MYKTGEINYTIGGYFTLQLELYTLQHMIEK